MWPIDLQFLVHRRLSRAQEATLAENPVAFSHPLDLDKLDARLRDVSDGNDSFSIARVQPIEPSSYSTDFIVHSARKEEEIEAYNGLINDGGRPLYPIDLLEEVFRDPNTFLETLQPWQFAQQRFTWEVFGKQFTRWKDFRRWQIDHRGIEEDDGRFPAYIERKKQSLAREYSPGAYARWLAQMEGDPSKYRAGWEHAHTSRQHQRVRHRESGSDGFLEYQQALKHRLAQHSFFRPFQLDEDPKHQNKLATWIEYLNFECWWLDEYIESKECLKLKHDAAWQKLVGSTVLGPNETQEFLRTDESIRRMKAEEEQAAKAVQRTEAEAAKVHALTQKDSGRSRIPEAKRTSMLKTALVKSLAAKDRLKLIKSRNDLITKFVQKASDYEAAKLKVSHHGLLVQWAMEQVPLVEAELTHSGASQAKSESLKRRLTTDEDDLEKQNPKRQKVDTRQLRAYASSSTSVSAKARETRAEAAIVANQAQTTKDNTKGAQTKQSATRRSLRSGNAAQVFSQGPRRSARIAARQHDPGMARAPDVAPAGVRSSASGNSVQSSRHKLSRVGSKSAVTKRETANSKRRGVTSKATRASKRSRRSQ